MLAFVSLDRGEPWKFAMLNDIIDLSTKHSFTNNWN